MINRLVDSSNVSSGETVVEIGPGTGNITSLLLERSRKVIVVEKNPKYRSVLKGRFGNDPKLEIVLDDALYFHFPRHDRLVSNLPYMISEPLLHRLFKINFTSASLIVSKGFAERITSDTTKSKLSYLANLMFQISKVSEVPRESYLPPPKIPTVIITIKHRPPGSNKEALLQAIFRQEDKKTGNALREALIQTGQAETKRLARQTVSSYPFPQLIDTPVGRLSYDQIKEIESGIF